MTYAGKASYGSLLPCIAGRQVPGDQDVWLTCQIFAWNMFTSWLKDAAWQMTHLCDMTHWYVWHDSFICVTWLIHICDMTHWYVWCHMFIDMCDVTCVMWLIRMCGMTLLMVNDKLREMIGRTRSYVCNIYDIFMYIHVYMHSCIHVYMHLYMYM